MNQSSDEQVQRMRSRRPSNKYRSKQRQASLFPYSLPSWGSKGGPAVLFLSSLPFWGSERGSAHPMTSSLILFLIWGGKGGSNRFILPPLPWRYCVRGGWKWAGSCLHMTVYLGELNLNLMYIQIYLFVIQSGIWTVWGFKFRMGLIARFGLRREEYQGLTLPLRGSHNLSLYLPLRLQESL